MKNLLKTLVSLAAVGLFSASTVSATTLGADFDYTNFQCDGCQSLEIVDYTRTSGALAGQEFMLGLFYDNSGDLRDGEGRTNVYFNSKAGSKIYFDVANDAVYIAAGATTYVQSTDGGHAPDADFLSGKEVQIYMSYTNNVHITTDANGKVTGFNVVGENFANNGFVLWEDNNFTTFTLTKANTAGDSAVGFGNDGKVSAWVQGYSPYVGPNGPTGFGTTYVKGDFHFNTRQNTEVPEPMSALLLGSALLGTFRMKKRK